MGKFNLYKLPLKSLPEGTLNYEYKLDNLFFKNIDGPEFQQGNLDVTLTVKRSGDTFELNFDIAGVIQIPCDLCLDSMDYEVATKEKLFVKFGKEFSDENDNVVIIPESEGELNIAWFLYEFIALTIPLKHVHPTGKCNKAMTKKLHKHKAKDANEEGMDDNQFEDDDEVIADEEVETDPRWDELKNIVDNN